MALVARSPRWAAWASVSMLALASSPVRAQAVAQTIGTGDATDARKADEEIVVTGTQIRGTAPVGSSVIALGRQEIETSAVTTINDVLKQAPQVYNLGVTESTRNTPGGSSNPTFSSSLNIRGIGPYATLTLIDSHRSVPQGPTGFGVDPSVVPLIAVERIEIVADGSSAVYGSDAIAGVGNIILRRRVEGAEVRAQVGFADGYRTRETAAIVGHDWGSGRFTLSLSESFHTRLSGPDRDFYRGDQRAFGGADYRNTQCDPGTLTQGGGSYAIPAGGVTAANVATLVRGTSNKCENVTLADLLPRQRRRSVLLTLDQALTSGVSLFGDAFYHRRNFTYVPGSLTATLTVPTTNAFYVAPAGATGTQTVAYSFESELPRNTITGYSTAYQGTLGLRAELFAGWRGELYGTYGHNHDFASSTRGLNNVAINAALASGNPATALDPYGLHRTTAAVLDAISNGRQIANGVTKYGDWGVKLDGSLFDLPGGAVRAAVGYEGQYSHVHNDSRQGTAVAPTVFVTNPAARRIDSLYGELHLPILASANGVPGLEALEVNVAGRYDSYNDVGGTWNPKIGVDWTPTAGVKLRGSYGTSFRAPVVVQSFGVSRSRFVQNYFDPTINATRVGVVFTGPNPDLEPEEAKTYSLGIDLTPKAVPGLKLSATFFSVTYEKQIASYLSDLTLLQREAQFAGTDLIIRNPTAAQLAPSSGFPVTGVLPATVTLLVDGRSKNLGTSVTQGIDFSVLYGFRNGMGSWSANLAGSYLTKYSFAATPAAPRQDLLNTIYNPLRLRMRGGINWSGDVVDAAIRANYVNSYKNNLVAPVQKIRSQTTIDLHLGVRPGGDSGSMLIRGLSLGIDVTNLFDRKPPYVNVSPGANGGGGYDPSTGDPIGRVISISLGKKF